jgi:putative transposase
VCWETSWKVDLDTGRLVVQGVGHIRLSKSAARQLWRLADRGGVPTTLTVTRRRAGTGWAWRACVGFTDVAATHTTPTQGSDSVVGADRGAAVTLALSDGQLCAMPGFVAEARDEIAELLRARDGKTEGSRAWRQLNRRIAKGDMRARQRSDNSARKTARDLVDTHGVIVLEDLKLANMTRSALGTKENPGRNVAAKQALNRILADAALGRLRHWVCPRAEEAGRRTWVVNPVDTSRTCAACGHCDTANRVTRGRFRCQRCGHIAHADLNAAENIAARGRVCEISRVAVAGAAQA